jgi:hypothetical protein
MFSRGDEDDNISIRQCSFRWESCSVEATTGSNATKLAVLRTSQEVRNRATCSFPNSFNRSLDGKQHSALALPRRNLPNGSIKILRLHQKKLALGHGMSSSLHWKLFEQRLTLIHRISLSSYWWGVGDPVRAFDPKVDNTIFAECLQRKPMVQWSQSDLSWSQLVAGINLLHAGK